MDAFKIALDMLPDKIRAEAARYSDSRAEEIRLRCGQPPSIVIAQREFFLNCGRLSPEDLKRTVERISGASLHAAAPTLKEGYINYKGLRVGLCGKAIIYKSEFKGFSDFSSLNIRIPRECKGICGELINDLYKNGFKNTLLISPPGLGKTTALREFIRVLSEKGFRIGVIDERNELSASDAGIAGFDLGSHSDILLALPKAQAAMLLLKAMNEDIIAMDEISSAADVSALTQIYGCGVGILASAHASGRDELYRRPLYRRLTELNIFTYIVRIILTSDGRKYIAERL